MARTHVKYRNCDLFAALWRGHYQGRAYCPFIGIELARTTGSSVDNVLEKLRAAVDASDIELQQRKAIADKHRALLLSRGIPVDDVSATELLGKIDSVKRLTHCFGCHEYIDNVADLECSRCGWIICGGCGACGCTHPKYGPTIGFRSKQSTTSLPAAPAPSAAELMRFSSFAEASAWVKEAGGGRIKRATNGGGWEIEATAAKP